MPRIGGPSARRPDGKRPVGNQPLECTDEIADAIVDRMAEGESLRSICRDPKMPCISTVLKWAATIPAFADRYARAREALADYHADSIAEMAKNVKDPQADRVRLDAMKWIASRMNPRKYGERVTNELVGAGGGPVQVTRIESVVVDPKDRP